MKYELTLKFKVRWSDSPAIKLLIESNKLREEDYYEIIGRKTAELFKASALSAALLSNANNKLVEASGNFAFSLGMVFQLRDDLLDYSGNKEITGKITGKDFMEGKVTLPLIKAFEFSSPKDLKFLNEASPYCRIQLLKICFYSYLIKYI